MLHTAFRALLSSARLQQELGGFAGSAALAAIGVVGEQDRIASPCPTRPMLSGPPLPNPAAGHAQRCPVPEAPGQYVGAVVLVAAVVTAIERLQTGNVRSHRIPGHPMMTLAIHP